MKNKVVFAAAIVSLFATVMTSACGEFGGHDSGPCPKGKNRVFCLVEFKGQSTNPNTPWKYCGSKRSVSFCAKNPAEAWLKTGGKAEDWYWSLASEATKAVAVPAINKIDADFKVDPTTGWSILKCERTDGNPWPNNSPVFLPSKAPQDAVMVSCDDDEEPCDPGYQTQDTTAGTQCEYIEDIGGPPPPLDGANYSCGESNATCGLPGEAVCCSSDIGTNDGCTLSVCN